MQKKFAHNNKGFALLLSLIISSVVLAIGLAILEISVNQINLSATARESELAFQSAHAGVDCVWYWRNELSSSYTASSGAVPSNNCFGTAPLIAPTATLLESSADGHARAFFYTYEWGSPERCTVVDMYVINATGNDMEVTFANEAIGQDGTKSCSFGNICTIIVSGGYNRPCDELGAGVFAVQREITVEF